MHTLLLLVNEKNRPAYLSLLESARLPELEIVTSPNPQVDLVLGDPSLVRQVIHEFPVLKWVQVTWAGVEPLLDLSLRRDYTLTNARGVFGSLMSEYVFAYLLLRERKILQRLEAQKSARWDEATTGSLKGKTFGLLGVGSIGAHLASTARHFGMHVRGYTRSNENCPDVEAWFHGSDLIPFAQGLDVLVCTLPGTPDTRRIIDARLLAALPPHAVLINIGRGSAIDESALVEALNHDRLGAAVLDVFEQEPLPPGHPFWRARNLYITGHTAGPSFPSDIGALFIENYRLFLAGQDLKYRVNFELGY